VTDFLPPVLAVLGANISEFQGKMREAKGEMKGSEESFASGALSGKKYFLGVGLAAAGLAYESVKAASKFDAAMEMIHTQAGAAQSEVDSLRGAVLALAPAVGLGPDVLAEGLYHIESAGFRGAEAMGILTSAAKLAQIGQSDFETTAQAVVGVMASQIKGVKDTSDAAAILNTTVGIGDMRMQALAQAIGTGLLPKAKAAGLSMEDVSAALATVTDNVTPADEAATRLGMTFSLMSAVTSKKAVEAYESIGMSANQMGNDLRSKGLLGALQDLKAHLDATYPAGKAVKLTLDQQRNAMALYSKSLEDTGVPVAQQTTLLKAYKEQLQKSGDAAVKQSEALSAMFGGGKSSGTILTLLNEMPRLEEKYKALGDSASRAAQMQDAWQHQQGLFKQQLSSLGATFEVLFVKIGERVIPVLSKFLGWIQSGIGWLRQHREVVELLAGLIGGALVAGLYAAAAGAVAFTVALDVNPIFLVITALGGLVVGLKEAYDHSETFRRIVQAVGKVFAEGWQETVKLAGEAIQWFVDGPLKWIRDRVDEFKAWWSEHGQEISEIARKAWHVISDIIAMDIKIIRRFLSVTLGTIKDEWKFTWDLVRNTFKLAWDAVADILVAGWHLILNVVGVFADLLTGNWGKLWKDVKKLVSEAWHDIYKVFSDFAGNAIHLLWQAGKDVVMGLIHGIGAMVSAALGSIGDIGSTILKWGKDAIKLLYDAGKDIVTGLINGVKDKVSDVENMFTSVGTSAVRAVEKVLDMHSPSRVMRGLGRNTGHGLVLGIEDMHGAVAAAAAGLGGAAMRGVTGSFGQSNAYAFGQPSFGGFALGGTAGGDMPSLQVQVFLDGRPVQGAVRTQTLRYQQRNSRNNLSLRGIGG
jgi:phage-related protein